VSDRMRVYEIAKEMLTDSKVILRVLRQMGVDVKNHMSTVDKSVARKVMDILMGKAELERPSPPKPTPRREAPQRGAKVAREEEPEILVEVEEQLEEEEEEVPRRRLRVREAREEETVERKVTIRRRRKGDRRRADREKPAPPAKVFVVGGTLSVKELAHKLGVSPAEVLKHLMQKGAMLTLNQPVSPELQATVAEAMGYTVKQEPGTQQEDIWEIPSAPDRPDQLRPRAPVVTVLGHVDHGKTTLLDAIRATNVAAREAGGITQHIGASVVEYQGKKIVFLDTPGHEAFTAMRARGAQVTDIAVLVVAADDGVMPQTVEAINHARAANVPIIVAINKIDKQNANVERTKQQLAERGLVPEDWGGDVVCVPVSAIQKRGLDDLLEMILLVAELEELKANPDKPARGTVIEAKLDRGRGPVATVLVSEGTLRIGDCFVVGLTYGKVRAMMDDRGRRVRECGPSMPVEVLGLVDVPRAGDKLVVVRDERRARELASKRQEWQRARETEATRRYTAEELLRQIREGESKELRLILKADVHGSLEALRDALLRLSREDIKVNILHEGVGAISESDVMLASASEAIIIGFHVRPDAMARREADAQGVTIKTYRVIYEALQEVEAMLKGLVEPEMVEEIIGHAEVRALFRIPRVGTVAGCYVTDGRITRDAQVRVIRDGVTVHEGTIASLKRYKDDVREVSSGYECGVGLARFQDLKEGDIIEAYLVKAVTPAE